MRTKLTAVILAKNEEQTIVDCLESLAFCDERLVIDDYSEDRTREIVEKIGAKVFTHSLGNDFAKQRNFGLDKSSYNWVLFVDADERVSEQLKNEITYKISKINGRAVSGFFIKRKDYMWDKKLAHGETGNVKLLRLARRDSGKWVGRVHEEWIVDGRLDTLESELIHYPHQTVKRFLEEINYYTDLRAKELHSQGLPAGKAGIPVYWASIIVYPLGKFFLNYFLKLGFLDGIRGFLHAVFMSFHSFLVRGKTWSLQEI